MQGRPIRRMAVGVALATAVGCAPRPAAVPPLAPGPGLATVTLQLEGFGEAPRATQVAPTFSRARLRIDGPAMPAERTANASFRLGATQLTVRNVPVGPNVVVLVEGLDASDRPLPGARYGTVVDLAPDTTVSAQVGPLTTPRAEVVLALLAEDRAASRSMEAAYSARLDDGALQTRLEAERSRLGLVHPALFDAAAIARSISAAANPNATTSLRPPSDLSGFARSPGRLRVRLKGLPTGAKASVWLDDPISPKQQNLAVGGYDILPIAPGRWTVSVEAPGGLATSVPVTVAEGLSGTPAEVLLDLSRWETLASLTKPLTATLCLPMTVGDVPSLVMVGGMDAVPSPVTRYATDSSYVFDGSRLAPLPLLPAPLSFASGAVVNGKLFVLGGLSETGQRTDQVYRLDAAEWTAVATASTAFAGAVSIAEGSTIYVFGGTLGLGGLVYDTQTGQFRSAPDMAITRRAPASAVYQDKLYVFGGGEDDPLGGSEVFDPKAGGWRTIESLPSPRHGARAVAHGGKIYVIGGVNKDGMPTSRVDVYDPAANAWAPFSALQTPRAASAVGVVGDRLFVMGGSDGRLAALLGGALDKPAALGAVEVLKP